MTMRGKHHTEESKRLQSLRMRGMVGWNTGQHTGISPFLGRTHGAASNEKNSLAHRELWKDPAYRERMLSSITARNKFQKPSRAANITETGLLTLGLVLGRTLMRETRPRALRLENSLYSFTANGCVYSTTFYKHTFDFVLPQRRIVIEVDGCYGHGCARCYSTTATPKQRQIHARDRSLNRVVRATGWKIVRLPTHEFDNVVDAVRLLLKKLPELRGRVP